LTFTHLVAWVKSIGWDLRAAFSTLTTTLVEAHRSSIGYLCLHAEWTVGGRVLGISCYGHCNTGAGWSYLLRSETISNHIVDVVILLPLLLLLLLDLDHTQLIFISLHSLPTSDSTVRNKQLIDGWTLQT